MTTSRRSALYRKIAGLFDELATLDDQTAADEARAIAAARVVAAAVAPSGPYHQGHLPPGETARSYLDKARAGAFPTSKTGRSVLCSAEDWDAYVAGLKRPAGPRASRGPANDTHAPPSDYPLPRKESLAESLVTSMGIPSQIGTR